MKTTILLLILFTALYFGVGGFIVLQNDQMYDAATKATALPVTVNGIQFRNKEVMETFKEQSLITVIFPYTENIPSALRFVITAISFGIIGSIGKIINDNIQNQTEINSVINLFLIPLQGGIIGVIVLGISYTIPIFLTNDAVTLKPITIVFLSLFGGLFYNRFYQWFSDAVDNIMARTS